MLLSVNGIEDVVPALAAWRPPAVPRWLLDAAPQP